jgi:glycosyltransferase involved in cell wall biosynthesis
MTRPVRVLHVLPDLDMGGGQQVLRRTLQCMDRERFRHFICYFLPNHQMKEAFRAAGAAVTYLPHVGAWSWFRSLPGILRLVRRERIDVIHINGTPIDKLHGQLAALLCRKPVVSTLHGPRWRPGPRWRLFKHRIRETAEHVLDPCTTRRVVAVSDYVLESWRPYLESRHVPRERLLVNRNGVPTAAFAPEEHREEIARLRRELEIEDTYPILITIGRLDANKAIEFLVRMMARVCERWTEARLYIVGEGPAEESLRSEIAMRELARNVVLLGRRDDVAALLGMSDVFVFSSLSEGLPLAVLEAMAACLPVVAFRLPGLDPLIENGVQGFQVEPGDAEALAERVLEVVADRQRAESMGRAGRQRVVEEYDLAESVQRLEQVYEEVAGS